LGCCCYLLFCTGCIAQSTGAFHAQTIAAARMLFSSLGVLMTIPFTPFFQRILDKMFPDKVQSAKVVVADA
jgi:Na+/phosphate symporter